MDGASVSSVSCRHGLIAEYCPLCRVHHAVNGLDAGSRNETAHLPDEVLVLGGGQFFHRRKSCRHLGREISRRQGQGLAIVVSACTPTQAVANSFTNCSGCLALDGLTSLSGFAAETISERKQRLKVRPRDFDDMKAIGLNEEEALDWWELGFTPSQSAYLIRSGIEFTTVLDEWLKSENANAAFQTLRSTAQ